MTLYSAVEAGAVFFWSSVIVIGSPLIMSLWRYINVTLDVFESCAAVTIVAKRHVVVTPSLRSLVWRYLGVLIVSGAGLVVVVSVRRCCPSLVTQ